ncbi:ferredoxin [Halobacteroides halobius DSM 5150]|uniref:Ferredoxin n=1 Tax=Halobacteroides halobius (strain ATCC 35273 / DSM 5150 / MD-1) TaxID=748449 RepID=L0KAW8_HALHC|nr:(2Fe-2S) ferredoxin domain-containing protein [Halobacteroides halobius]AGB42161.1 ferredoxin [Halobacteroides halobius DSM 5150]
MKSLDELKELRKKAQKDLQTRDTINKPKVIVGMGTCGIAAGAREVMKALVKEVNKRDLDVIITQTGCIGMCEKEPLVDVQLPGKDRITYGPVTVDDVKKIIAGHIVNGHIVEDLVVARLEE